MPLSVFQGRGVPAPGEPMFLPADSAAVLALAMEEADACKQCGLPKAICRDNKTGRARFDVDEEFCWASYRIAQRQIKQDKEKVDPATKAGYVHAPKFRSGQEPDMLAGLGIDG